MSFLIGMTGIVLCLRFVFTHHNEGFTGYFDVPAIVLVGFVPPCIMLLSRNISDFVTGLSALAQSMFNSVERKHRSVINALTICSARVRSEGVSSLIQERKRISYDLLVDGVSLIINNFTDDEIRHNLSAKVAARQTKMNSAATLFENMSKVSPGVGMIGTLMGLIAMMANLSDPTAIGSNMAMALIATFYGLMLGTVIYAPFGEKIATEAEKMYEIDLLVLEGVMALKGKKSSIHMKDIMKTYGKKGVTSNEPPKSRGPTRG